MMPKAPKYEWGPNARMPASVDVQQAGEYLASLGERLGGTLQAHEVVNAARDENSPIHDCFEWDDSIAAEQFRQDQARNLIRAIRVKVRVNHVETQPVRAFLNVKFTEVGQAYVPVQDAMTRPVYRDQILQDALDELKALQAKYKHLSELACIFEQIDQLEKLKQAA